MNRTAVDTIESTLNRIAKVLSKSNSKKKKKTEQASYDKYTAHIVDADGCAVSGQISNEAAFFSRGNKLVLSTGDTYDIVPDNPSIESLAVWGKPIEGCPLTPMISLAYCEPDICCWTWKRKQQNDFVVIASTKTYTPCKEDIGQILQVCCALDCEYSTQTWFTLTSETLAEPPREITIERQKLFRERNKSGIRIVSYNVLADAYSHTWDTMYSYCDAQHLDPWYRASLLIREVKDYNSDIIALQEVDSLTFDRFWRPQLEDDYQGFFTEKAGATREGCATFWRTSKFHRRNIQQVVFKDCIEERKSQYMWLRDLLKAIPEVASCIPKITTVAQICVLDQINSDDNRSVIFTNSHLFYHPIAGNIRCMQLKLLTELVSEAFLKLPDPEKIGIIMTGDFNAQSYDLPMKFMLNGHVSAMHEDWASSSLFRWGSKANFARIQNPDASSPNMIVTGTNAGNKTGEIDDIVIAELENLVSKGATMDDHLKAYFSIQQFQNEPQLNDIREKILTVLQNDRQDAILHQNQFSSQADGLLRDFSVGVGANLVHNFSFISACGFPAFTNYVSTFMGDLDWILISSKKFRVENIVSFPSEGVLPYCPSESFPSDHLSLCCDIQWHATNN